MIHVVGVRRPRSPAGCSAINPFDQPDVEAAKKAARVAAGRAGRDADRHRPLWTVRSRCTRRTACCRRARPRSPTRCAAFLGTVPELGYLAVQAYLDRIADASAIVLRAELARRTGRADHVRLGSALPALHRPVPQGRPPERRVPAADRRGRPTTWQVPGPAVHAGHAAARAGARRRRRCWPSAAARCCGCTSPTGPRAWPTWSRPFRRSARDTQPGRTRCATRGTSGCPRIAGPCGLVIFGVTGDLSRKKLMPAIYDLANRGPAAAGLRARRLRPPRLGRRGLRPGRATTRSSSTRAPRSGRRSGTGWPRASGSCRARSTTTTRSTASTPPSPTSTGSAAPAATTRSTCRSRRARSRWCCKQLARSGLAAQDGRPVAPGGHREAVRPRPAVGDRAQRDRQRRLPRGVGVPHRPLPRQGDRAEHPGAAVRQPAVRADLERQLRRPRADHDGRGHRPRRPRRLLRRHRRRPRRDPEPPAAAARAHRDGGADLVLAPTSCAPRRSRSSTPTQLGRPARRDHRARPVHRRLAGRRAGARACKEEEGFDPDSTHRDLRGDHLRGRHPPLGRGAVLPAHRQAARAGASPRSRWCSSGPRTCRSTRR